MNDSINTSTSKLPSHAAYQVRDRDEGKSVWTRIGNAWIHADGKGFNIQLDAVPLDGRITLRVPLPPRDATLEESSISKQAD